MPDDDVAVALVAVAARCAQLGQLGLDDEAADQLLDAIDAGDPQHPAAADPAQARGADRVAPGERPVERVVDVRGVDRANEQLGHLVVESKLPARGTPKSDSYEGDGYVIVRDPDTEVVTAAIKTIIETIGIEYG